MNRSFGLLAVLLGFVLCPALAAAADDAPRPQTNSPPAGTRQLRDQLQAVVTQLAASGALGSDPSAVNLSVHAPAHRVADLGVVVDSNRNADADNGLRVVATTPGSTASRIGLRPGDVLVAINGTSLQNLGNDDEGRPLAAATLKSTVSSLADAAPLNLKLRRSGHLMTIHGTMRSVHVPAMQVLLGSAAIAAAGNERQGAEAASGCGRISTFDVAPRGKRQYHARIMLLDGKTPGTTGQETYRVSPGEHTLLVAEDIPTLRIGVGEIATLRRHTRKILHVDVKPDTTVMIAAQLHLDKVTRLNSGEYWDPVAWRVAHESCP